MEHWTEIRTFVTDFCNRYVMHPCLNSREVFKTGSTSKRVLKLNALVGSCQASAKVRRVFQEANEKFFPHKEHMFAKKHILPSKWNNSCANTRMVWHWTEIRPSVAGFFNQSVLHKCLNARKFVRREVRARWCGN
jgi:hypothetical protein